MPFPRLNAALERALEARGYAEPTEVQAAVLATEADGRDLLVSARTGSGKTVAYGLAFAPDLLGTTERAAQGGPPLALVIAPTRELAMQVQGELEWLYAQAGALKWRGSAGDFRSGRNDLIAPAAPQPVRAKASTMIRACGLREERRKMQPVLARVACGAELPREKTPAADDVAEQFRRHQENGFRMRCLRDGPARPCHILRGTFFSSG